VLLRRLNNKMWRLERAGIGTRPSFLQIFLSKESSSLVG